MKKLNLKLKNLVLYRYNNLCQNCGSKEIIKLPISDSWSIHVFCLTCSSYAVISFYDQQGAEGTGAEAIIENLYTITD